MNKCIFCGEALSDAEKPEHIILNALGGRRTTKTAICSSCNETFGGSCDKKLAEQFSLVRNLLGLRSGNRKPAPSIKGKDSAGKTYEILEGGTPNPKYKPFEIKNSENGKYQIHLENESYEKISEFIPHISAKTGVSEEDIKKAIDDEIRKGNAQRVFFRADDIHFSIEHLGHDFFRSMGKMALVLWSTAVGNDELLLPEYKIAKDYIRGGDGVGVKTNKISAKPNFIRLSGICPTVLGVGCYENGEVWGYLNVYGIMGGSIKLGTTSRYKNKHILMVSDPLDHSQDRVEDIAVPLNFVSTDRFDMDEVKKNYEKLPLSGMREGWN